MVFIASVAFCLGRHAWITKNPRPLPAVGFCRKSTQRRQAPTASPITTTTSSTCRAIFVIAANLVGVPSPVKHLMLFFGERSAKSKCERHTSLLRVPSKSDGLFTHVVWPFLQAFDPPPVLYNSHDVSHAESACQRDGSADPAAGAQSRTAGQRRIKSPCVHQPRSGNANFAPRRSPFAGRRRTVLDP